MALEQDLEARMSAKIADDEAASLARKEEMTRQALVEAAYRLGAVYPGAVGQLADRSQLEFDSLGRVANAGTVAAALLKERPYLAAPVQTAPAAPRVLPQPYVAPVGQSEATVPATE